MTSRERILAVVGHKSPDRVPVDLGATPSSGISIVAYDNLLDWLGLDYPVYGYDVIQQVAQPQAEILERFDVDVLDVGRFFNEDPGYWHELELTFSIRQSFLTSTAIRPISSLSVRTCS